MKTTSAQAEQSRLWSNREVVKKENVSTLRDAVLEAAGYKDNGKETRKDPRCFTTSPIATSRTASGVVQWTTEEGAALLAAEILHKNAFAPNNDITTDERGKESLSSSLLEAIVALCGAGSKGVARRSNRTHVPFSAESDPRGKVDKVSSIELPVHGVVEGGGEAAYNCCGDTLTSPRCETWLQTNAVLKSMAMLVGASIIPSKSPACAVGCGSPTSDPIEGDRDKRVVVGHDQYREVSPLSPAPLPPSQPLVGGTDGDHIGRVSSPPSQSRGLRVLLPPPMPMKPPQPGANMTSQTLEDDISQPIPGKMDRSHRICGGRTGSNNQSAGIDQDNSRKLLFEGVLKLLQGLFKENEKKQGKTAEERIAFGYTTKQGGGISIWEANRSLVWDIVIAVLSDSWSEIRKMGGAHLRRLAVILGGVKARSLYAKAAVTCNRSLLLPESESSLPREWKRIHGLLLGMRAVLEATASSVDSPSALTTATSTSTTSSHSSPSVSPGEKYTTANDVNPSCEGDRLCRSNTSRERAEEAPSEEVVAQYTAEVIAACENVPRPPSPWPLAPLSSSLAAIAAAAPESHAMSAQWREATAAVRPRQETTIHPTLEEVVGVDVAFGCLSHRQTAVKEAAVGLLHTQACFLGSLAALTLYRRTIRNLEEEQEDEVSNEQEVESMEDQGGSRMKSLCRSKVKAPENFDTGSAKPNTSSWTDKGADLANTRSPKTGDGTRRRPSYQAGKRRRRYRIHGLLSFLERVIERVGPSIGKTWESLFGVLRHYLGHPEASVRQAAGAVLIRIAAIFPSTNTLSSGHPISSKLAVTLPPSALKWREGFDPSQRPGSSSNPRHHLPSRIVLWALIRASLPAQEALNGEAENISGVEEAAAERDSGSGDEADSTGSVTTPSWEFREGTLLVYEGILKRLQNGCKSRVFYGDTPGDVGGGSFDQRAVFPVTSPPAIATVAANATGSDVTATATSVVDSSTTAVHTSSHDDDKQYPGIWPAEVISSTPPLSELLVYLLRQAEEALYEAELIRSTTSPRHHQCCRPMEKQDKLHPHQLASVGCPNGLQATTRASLGDRREPLQNPGSLELWRTGSQLLPAIARALVWWNQEAIVGVFARAGATGIRPRTDAAEDKNHSSTRRMYPRSGCPLRLPPEPPLTILRRRTLISVACELLRASVKHARQLAEEIYDDHYNGASDDGNSMRHGMITIANPERWGCISDGIADTSGDSEPEISRTMKASTASSERMLSVVASSESRGKIAGKMSAVARGRGKSDEEWDPVFLRHALVARVVGGILKIARQAPPLLVRALDELRRDDGILPEPGRKQLRDKVMDRRAANASCQDSSYDAPRVVIPPVKGTSENLGNYQQWVFSGVIEAIVLAESLRATTAVQDFSTKASQTTVENHETSVYDSRCERRHTSVSSLPASNLRLDDPRFEDEKSDEATCEATSLLSTGNPQSPSAEEQLHSSRVVGWPTTTGEEILLHFSLVENQLEMIHREAFPPKSIDDGLSALSGTPKFVVPFSWGSLSLLNLPSPREERRKGASKGGVGGSDGLRQERLQDLQNRRRRAVQLDRLLSARIVGALPGYVTLLSPRRCVGLIPSLLCWLEASDHNVRWIVVSRLEAHKYLLSAISIAVQRITAASNNRLVQRRQPQHQELFEEDREKHGAAPRTSSIERDDITTVISSLVGRVKRLLKSEEAGGIVGTSLFPKTCALARDVVDLLAILRQQKLELRVSLSMSREKNTTPASVDTRHATGCGSAKKKTLFYCGDGGIASPMKDSDNVVTSLLQSVAENLLRWYPECSVADQEERKYDSQDPNSDRNRDYSLGEDGPSSDGRCGSYWDDWDDDDEDDSERTLAAADGAAKDDNSLASRSVKDAEVRLSDALNATAAFMKSAMAYTCAAPATRAAEAPEEAEAEIVRHNAHRSPSTCTENVSQSSPTNVKLPRQEEAPSLQESHTEREPAQDIHKKNSLVGGGETKEGEYTQAPAIDHGGTCFDQDHLSLERVLEGLPSGCRDALLRAWKFGTFAVPT